MHNDVIILDLEATCCDQDTVPRDEMEIIEIGAVRVDAASGEILSEFQAFIRPQRHPLLTDFCHQLTTIRQSDVEVADAFPEVMASFAEWLAEAGESDWCSWGDYDRKQFEQDAVFHGIELPFTGVHRNLKAEFSAAQNTKKRFGLGRALWRLGLKFDGTAHRGIDDARNIARVYQWMMGKA